MTKMQDCYRNVNLLDIYPTLIDLCKLPKKELDGNSFAPLLKNPTLKWTPAITTMDKGNHSVITEKWHYINREKNGVEELYDLENDPMEWTNLANKKTNELEALKKELRLYMPVNNADAVANDSKGDSDKEKVDGSNTPDLTLKSKRKLSELK
ncbi:MAG: hypothetical protein MUF39_09825 [Cyclobacteriaceae bacterium]|nr:hypothetical protein [Cyclobacteriaceae bacterium]